MSKIETLIKRKETDGFKFKPDRKFYQRIGIGQKRFWMIVEKKVSPTTFELKSIADYFEVDPLELFEV